MNNRDHHKIDQYAPPPRRDRTLRTAALVAYRICTNCRTYNPDRSDVYLRCVFHLLYTIIRSAAPRLVPVPNHFNRSTVSWAEKRFNNEFSAEYQKVERQAYRHRRPVQPGIVTEAMSMLPLARGGTGPQKFAQFQKTVPAHLQPILRLMAVGTEMLLLRERSLLNKMQNP